MSVLKAIITFRYNRYILLHINRYKLVMSKCWTSTLKALDFTRYDGPVTRTREVKRFQRMNLSNFQNKQITKSVKANKLNWLRLKTNKSKSVLVLIIATSVITQGNTYANAATSLDHYKLYLHSKIISEKQYKCAYYIAHIESRWNYKSSNGNHYGLFQMKNNKVRYMNAYQQIDLWSKYVAHRYKGNYCLAMHHLKTRGWQ